MGIPRIFPLFFILTQVLIFTTCQGSSTQSVSGCASNPCPGLSTCVPVGTGQGYMCCFEVGNLFVNSTGHLCFPCNTNPCGNDGTCRVDGTKDYGYFCDCPDGTSGLSCTNPTTQMRPMYACMSYPCTGQSTCVEADNEQGYMCCDYVSKRYINSTGHLCFPCDTNPCGYYATCHVDKTNSLGYLCDCPDGTTGHSCSYPEETSPTRRQNWKLPVIIGGAIGAVIICILTVVITIYFLRKKSSNTPGQIISRSDDQFPLSDLGGPNELSRNPNIIGSGENIGQSDYYATHTKDEHSAF